MNRSPSLQRISFEVLEDRTTPVTITVNTLADVVAADGFISLREAIAAANADTPVNDAPAGSGADIINFSVTGTIALSLGKFTIINDLTIDGPGAGLLAIDGSSASQIFQINDGLMTSIDVEINNLTLTNGDDGAGGSGGAIFNAEFFTLQNSVISGNIAGDGGGISNSGALFVDSTLFSSNYGYVLGGNGGAVYNTGTATFTRSTFSGNVAYSGGAIFNQNGQVSISDSTITGNFAGGGASGGGIESTGASALLVILSSTINNNYSSGSGAGVFVNGGTFVMQNSTVSDNTSVSMTGGGGVHLTGATATITHSTITLNNSGSPGAGLLLQSGSLNIEHTILSGNLGSNDLHLVVTPVNANYNVIEKLSGTLPGSATGNIIGQSALLGALADNGGLTFTHLPMAGSPAVDAGNPLFSGTPSADQRGFPRVAGAAIDIGSVETGSAACTVTAMMSGSDLVITGCPDDNVISISASSGGFVVVFADSMLIGSFLNPARILVDAQAGNDFISIDSSLTVPCSVLGGDGDDTLLSGAGADTLIGGLGNDRYHFHDGFGLDTVIEILGEGFDTLDLSEVTTTYTFELGGEGLPSDQTSAFQFEADAFEQLILGSGDDFVALRDDATAINLAINGGPGTDTLDYSFSTLTGTVDLGAGSAPGLLSAVNFENVVGLEFVSGSASSASAAAQLPDTTRRHSAGAHFESMDEELIS